ncbi:uncharacterized protein ARMOST_20824 [Armillaria ostoyae]|uniref:Uncharacterized protein n=1 Tax=Armillaria ostoyae TaxID=47428 RepID=A0A284S8E1_ARMOS|nr:uncharacterized protein ARMOST_20824 [Armillaria ostoyae]
MEQACGIEGSTFAGNISFVPIPATATIAFNTGLEYGRRKHPSGPRSKCRLRASNACGHAWKVLRACGCLDEWFSPFVHGGGLRMSDGTSSSLVAGQKCYAFTGVPSSTLTRMICITVTLKTCTGDIYAGVDWNTPGSQIWRFERLSTRLARLQVHSATGGDSPPRPTSQHRMIAWWDRVPSEVAKAVVLDSRKQHLAIIMDYRHYSPDTPTEGRRDREGRTTRGPRNAGRRFDEQRGYGVDRNLLR